jgi:hypothetical protein
VAGMGQGWAHACPSGRFLRTSRRGGMHPPPPLAAAARATAAAGLHVLAVSGPGQDGGLTA